MFDEQHIHNVFQQKPESNTIQQERPNIMNSHKNWNDKDWFFLSFTKHRRTDNKGTQWQSHQMLQKIETAFVPTFNDEGEVKGDVIYACEYSHRIFFDEYHNRQIVAVRIISPMPTLNRKINVPFSFTEESGRWEFADRSRIGCTIVFRPNDEGVRLLQKSNDPKIQEWQAAPEELVWSRHNGRVHIYTCRLIEPTVKSGMNSVEGKTAVNNSKLSRAERRQQARQLGVKTAAHLDGTAAPKHRPKTDNRYDE